MAPEHPETQQEGRRWPALWIVETDRPDTDDVESLAIWGYSANDVVPHDSEPPFEEYVSQAALQEVEGQRELIADEADRLAAIGTEVQNRAEAAEARALSAEEGLRDLREVVRRRIEQAKQALDPEQGAVRDDTAWERLDSALKFLAAHEGRESEKACERCGGKRRLQVTDAEYEDGIANHPCPACTPQHDPPVSGGGGVGEAAPDKVAAELDALKSYQARMRAAAESEEFGGPYNTGRADGAQRGILALERLAAATRCGHISERHADD